jgi:glycosyltransferase involved in cell wall biosynthesis
MMEPRIRYVVYRYSHHSPHSGYSKVAEYGKKLFDSEIIQVEKPFSRKIIRERMLWKIIEGTPGYDRASMAAEFQVAYLLLKEKAYIYHFLYGETTYHYSGLLNNIQDNRIIATFHLPPSGIKHAMQIDWPIKKLSAVVCVGRNQVGFFDKIIDPNRIFFVPLGVATDYFTPPSNFKDRDPDLCLIVGDNYRDFPTLRGVIELVSYLRPRTKFIVVMSDKKKSLLGQHPNLSFKSGIPEPELLHLYRSASILLMPLHDATANNSILEAMSTGLPMVLTDIGAVRDYVRPDCALLIPPYQAQVMSEAVLDLLNNEAARKNMSILCREHAMNFSWKKSVNKLLQVYHAVR